MEEKCCIVSELQGLKVDQIGQSGPHGTFGSHFDPLLMEWQSWFYLQNWSLGQGLSGSGGSSYHGGGGVNNQKNEKFLEFHEMVRNHTFPFGGLVFSHLCCRQWQQQWRHGESDKPRSLAARRRARLKNKVDTSDAGLLQETEGTLSCHLRRSGGRKWTTATRNKTTEGTNWTTFQTVYVDILWLLFEFVTRHFLWNVLCEGSLVSEKMFIFFSHANNSNCRLLFISSEVFLWGWRTEERIVWIETRE